MKQELRQAYISRISTELTNLVNGPKFEQFGYIIADHVYSDYELVHRGTNISGAPVGYVVDTFSNCGKVVCEYSSDEKFFLNFSKINNDIQHALTHHKNSLESIFLLSNRLCKPINQKKLTTIISDTKKNLGVDVKIWDSRTISEYIVDEILLEESTVERLINFLPCIQTIRNESILNLTLPKVDSSYQPRKDLETEIITKLLAGNSLAITGFGGTGKSSFASSISHSIKENFDIPLWLDASEITDIEHLGHYDVYRNGHKVNVLGLLQSKKILLILDDLSAPVSITHLASLCKNGSVIIVTRKNSFDDDDWEIPPLDAAAVKNILDHNTETACPDKIFKKVYNTVGGHPLIYSLMNANIRSKYYNWEDIESDCEAISEYEDDRNQKLTVRLIGHIVGRLETQLSFLKSCNSKVIDLGFAKYAIKPIGVKKLIKSTILTMSGSGFLKIHDIIFEALTNITIVQTDISPILNDYLKNTEADQWSAFLRVSHRHRDAIYKRYKTQGESIYLYSHLISSTPAHLLKNEITRPQIQFNAIKSDLPTVDRVKVLTLIETIENIYLLNKESSLDLATLELEDSIPLFLELIKIVSKDLKLIKSVRHHYAKCLLRLKREVEAEAEFSNLSKEQPPMYEAKLQLARIYARTNRANEAKIQIEEILDGWQFDAGPSVSVALASFELISRSTMRKFKTMLNTKYSDTIASIIKETMAFGYDHSYRAFSVFSGDWAYNHPEKFLDVFGFLPLPQISSLSDNNTKNSVGDLYREAGKICLRDGNPISDTYLGLAIEFYTSVEHANAFYLRRLAESYCLKKQYSEAEKILLSLLDQDSKEPFVYFWLSKSLLGLERVLEALKNIDIGIEILDANQMGYKSSFLEIKSDIHRLIGRDDYLEILNEAKTLCDSPKYELQLANKIKDLSLTTFK